SHSDSVEFEGSSLVYRSGPKKSLKQKRNSNSATAAMAGLARRRNTETRIRNSPQPSTRAASAYSSGIVMKNCRRRKIEKASPRKFGMMSGDRDPTTCSFENNTQTGTTETPKGSINAQRPTTNKTPRTGT